MGRRVLWRHTWGYSICLCPIKRTPGLYGLSPCTLTFVGVGLISLISFETYWYVTAYLLCVCSWFYQWYQWYTNIVQGYTIGTNGNASGTICSPNGTVGTIGKPMVPLATNGTIGKITNGTIGRTPNRAYNKLDATVCVPNVKSNNAVNHFVVPFNCMPLVAATKRYSFEFVGSSISEST